MKIKAYLAIVLVFLLGMLSGGLLVAQLAKSKVQSLAASSTEELADIVMERLDRDLELSNEQHEAVSRILAAAAGEVAPMRAEFRASALTLIQKYQAQIGNELDDEQRREFEAIVATFKKRSNLEGGREQDVPQDP
jgi:CHASE1-domain containing sensor protein